MTARGRTIARRCPLCTIYRLLGIVHMIYQINVCAWHVAPEEAEEAALNKSLSAETDAER